MKHWVLVYNFRMKKYLIILILLLLSCVRRHPNDSSFEGDVSQASISETIKLDSIELSQQPEGRDQDNLVFFVYNSTTDTITVFPTYYINNQSTPELNIVIGNSFEFPQIIPPQNDFVFKINLGLDSVEYRKNCTYNIRILGESKHSKIVFYKSLKLGNRYRLDGETILEPDTIIVPLLYLE